MLTHTHTNEYSKSKHQRGELSAWRIILTGDIRLKNDMLGDICFKKLVFGGKFPVIISEKYFF